MALSKPIAYALLFQSRYLSLDDTLVPLPLLVWKVCDIKILDEELYSREVEV